ncbi:dihydroorotate dehydrogenase electron transfer subunit [Cupriavidus sp. YR651]|uniref:dihydroorotate dehydrogenase electron transfer subunit n=1 Tax=Cupriavidus sp. YR651 TaxID=1855315 RepID=UPI00088E50A5|nr:dihydroorotate dehydrogenase electron transfer subunit [Cupriavidus sp. YR651]SDC67232.1 dihydroorotate dehydrogenase electron transfer subunit [Cupriavidus sp. YR651]
MCATVCSPDSAATVASYRCRIVEHYWVNQRYKYIRLESDAPIANITRPGQFYQLNCPTTAEEQPFLLRPMSVYGAGPEAGRIEFLYNVTGVGTRAMATLPVDGHMDIVGPLGNTFTFEPAFRRILVVARGVGLATMAPLIHEAAAAGVGITAVMSARTSGDLMEKQFLRGATAEVHSVFDADGTSSVEAVEALIRRLIADQRPDAIYTCGSHRLLMLLQRVLQDHPDVQGEVAMEQRMACGMGVCLSCVRLFDCDGDKQFLRVCREGPVFKIREVVGEVEFG